MTLLTPRQLRKGPNTIEKIYLLVAFLIIFSSIVSIGYLFKSL